MPQDIEIDLPDGSVGVFPEGTPNETIEQTLSQQFPTDRSRRATGDQDQPGSPPPLPGDEPDPLSGVATEIDGVTLNGEERQAIAHARTLDDPKEQNLIAARLAARIDQRSNSGNFAAQISRSGVGAAMRGFINMFGIGDLSGAAGIALSTDMSFTDALELQGEFRRAGEEKFPIISTGSEIAGAILGAGAIGAGVKALAAGTRAAPIVSSLVGFKEGQKVKNIARASALAASEGAITEGVTEDNAGGGALIGAAGGTAGLALAKTLGVALPVFARGLSQARDIARPTKEIIQSSGAKGLKILADKIGEPIEDLFQRFQQLKALTGKPPSIAELTNKQAALELRKLLEQSPDATKRAQDLAENTLSTRSGEIAKDLSAGGIKPPVARLIKERDNQADKLFALAHKEDIPFTRDQAKQLLESPDLRDAIPRSLRLEVDDALQKAGQSSALDDAAAVFTKNAAIPDKPFLTVKGKTLDDIRQSLNEKVGAGFKTRFKDLSEQLTETGEAGSPAFATAVTSFRRASERIDGAKLGQKVVKRDDNSEFIEEIAQLPPSGTVGSFGGARQSLSDTAEKNLTGATQLVNDLASNSGLVKRLRALLPGNGEEVDLIIDTAKAHKQALEGLAGATPRTKVGEGIADVLPTLVNTVVALSPTTSAASKVFSGGRLAGAFKRLVSGNVEERVLKNLAEDIFDPSKTEAVIQALRRSGAKDVDIIEAIVSSLGGATTAQQALE